jgi:hypothetical protein
LSPNGSTSSTSYQRPERRRHPLVGADVGDRLVDQPAVDERDELRDQVRADDRPVRLEQPRARRAHRRAGHRVVAQHGPAGQQRGRAARPGAQPTGPQDGLLDISAERHQLDLDVVRQRLVVDAGGHLGGQAADPGAPGQDVGQRRGVRPRVEHPPAAGPAGRVDEDRRRRRQGQRGDVGPDEGDPPAQHLGVGAGQQEAGLVEVDAGRAGRQREQVAADRAAQVEDGTVEAGRPVRGHDGGRGLLERGSGPPQLVATRVLRPGALLEQRLLQDEGTELGAGGRAHQLGGTQAPRG